MIIQMCKVNPVKNNSVLFLSVAETNSLCHIAIERYSIKTGAILPETRFFDQQLGSEYNSVRHELLVKTEKTEQKPNI